MLESLAQASCLGNALLRTAACTVNMNLSLLSPAGADSACFIVPLSTRQCRDFPVMQCMQPVILPTFNAWESAIAS